MNDNSMVNPRLEEIAVVALAWHAKFPDSPKPHLSSCRKVGRVILLFDANEVLLAEISDDLEISHSNLPSAPASAIVEDTTLVVRCWKCNRRCLRLLSTYTPRSQFRCPGCGHTNVLRTLDAVARDLRPAG